jgi:hypothetical protein
MTLRSFVRAFAALFAAGMLTACSTPYRPLNNGHGFSDEGQNTNEARVSFFGNGNTSSQKVLDFAMRRSAELTLEKGFSHFSVLDVINQGTATPYTIPPRMYVLSPLPRSGSGVYAPGPLEIYSEPMEQRVYTEPATTFVIRMFHEGSETEQRYDAAEVLRQMTNQRS